MPLLGAMGAKRAHQYKNKTIVGIGLSSFGVLGSECTITCYVSAPGYSTATFRFRSGYGSYAQLQWGSGAGLSAYCMLSIRGHTEQSPTTPPAWQPIPDWYSALH